MAEQPEPVPTSAGFQLGKYGMIVLASTGISAAIGARWSTPENRLKPVFDGAITGMFIGAIIAGGVAMTSNPLVNAAVHAYGVRNAVKAMAK